MCSNNDIGRRRRWWWWRWWRNDIEVQQTSLENSWGEFTSESHLMFSYHPFLAFETSASRKNLKLLITPWSLNVLQLKKKAPMLHTLQAWISSPPPPPPPSSSWTSNSCKWFKCPMLCESWLKFTTMQLFVCFLLMGWNLFLVGFFHVGYPNSVRKTTYWCCNGNVKKVVEIVNFHFFSKSQVKWDCWTFKEFLLQISLWPGSSEKHLERMTRGVETQTWRRGSVLIPMRRYTMSIAHPLWQLPRQ